MFIHSCITPVLQLNVSLRQRSVWSGFIWSLFKCLLWRSWFHIGKKQFFSICDLLHIPCQTSSKSVKFYSNIWRCSQFRTNLLVVTVADAIFEICLFQPRGFKGDIIGVLNICQCGRHGDYIGYRNKSIYSNIYKYMPQIQFLNRSKRLRGTYIQKLSHRKSMS